ncbi:MAG: hypothetical protein NTZ34_07635 [Chloroflexi bacterium]|nr:hypothetical protein [Chloroflexota bacterium]
MDHNLSFSQRQGLTPIATELQLTSMSAGLRNRLWTVCTVLFWEQLHTYGSSSFRVLQDRCDELYSSDYEAIKSSKVLLLLTSIYIRFFNLPIDDLLNSDVGDVIKHIRKYFYESAYNEVYDFLEFIAKNYKNENILDTFYEVCNHAFEGELSGYRFINGLLSSITSDIEIGSIQAAIDNSGTLDPVSAHIADALKKLSDRENPDFRNSIKESISAVEAICRVITNNPKATLGDALKAFDGKLEIHEALKQSFLKIYGYTSDADGIRHALIDKDTVAFEDAYYMLVCCSAFTNYLKEKAVKAGIFSSEP